MNIGLGSTNINRILLDLENRRRNNEEETPELPETPSESIAPAPKTITASISDVLAAQNLILVSTSKTTPVPNGTYILPSGQVVVHDDDDGNIGLQFVGQGELTLDELRKLINKGLLPVSGDNQPAQGVNGEIDEPVSQGATGDCWILTGILSLSATEEGKALIKASMEIQNNGDVIVNFKGLGYSVRVTAAEIKKHDTDDIKNDPFSNGDNDMLVFELAVQKLFEEHPDLRTAYGYEEGWQGDDRYITQGGWSDNLVEWLSGNESQGISALDKLGDPYEQAGVVEWVTVPASVAKYAGKEFPRPSSISFDAMFDSSKTNFSDEYIHWYNETYAPIVQEYNDEAPQLLVDGLSSEETLAQLQEAYENQPCAVTFGMYVFANDTEKTAQCVDGTTFSWKYYSKNVDKGELCGHAFAVVGMTQDTITFVNPWDSTQEITMTWDEFAKLGIGRISYNKLDEIKNDDEGSEVGDADNTPSVPTFQKAELAGLDNAAIVRYFIANADGTYSLNEANVKADFPEAEYGKIDTPAKLKEAIAKKAEADQTSSVTGAGGAGGASGAKGDFGTINELSNYLFSTLRNDSDIKNLKFDKGFSYEEIAEIVRNKHTEDFATVTKEQLKNEFLMEYMKKAVSGHINNDPFQQVNGFKDMNEVIDYMNSDELKTQIKQSLEANGYVFDETVYEQIINTMTGTYKEKADELAKLLTKESILDEVLAQCEMKMDTASAIYMPERMFTNYDELIEFVHGEACYRAVLGKMEMTGDGWKQLTDYILAEHKSDYARVSNMDIVEEMKAAMNDNSNKITHGTWIDDLKNKYGLKDYEIQQYFVKSGDRYYLKAGIYSSRFKLKELGLGSVGDSRKQITSIEDLISDVIQPERDMYSRPYNPRDWSNEYIETPDGNGNYICTSTGYNAASIERYIPQDIISAYFQKNDNGRYELKDGISNFKLVDYDKTTKIAKYSIDITKTDGEVVTLEFEIDVNTGTLKSKQLK